jgi:integrase
LLVLDFSIFLAISSLTTVLTTDKLKKVARHANDVPSRERNLVRRSRMSKSRRIIQSGKSYKPYPDFPLTAHVATKRWCKKIKGRMFYFGSLDDGWEAALQKYLDQKDDLHAGRTPRKGGDGYTVEAMCFDFLDAKNNAVQTGELSPRTFDDYRRVCKDVCEHFGRDRLVEQLRPEDFGALRLALAKTRKAVALRNTIQRVRSVFKFAYENALVEKPVRYGDQFKRPSKKTLRLDRNASGPRCFSALEIRAMLFSHFVASKKPIASPAMRAMILLGLNCGLGNADIGRLEFANLDLDAGVLDFPRPKTGVQRKCFLWPETIDALRVAIAKRPTPKDKSLADRVFITQRGLSWFKDKADSPVSKEMRKLLDAVGLNGHRGFYSLRHTLRTVAGDVGDERAIDAVMGHAESDRDMGAVYTATIPDNRLKKVTDYVRAWLFDGLTSATETR